MVKRIGRRFVSLLLTFVTVLTMLPAMTLPALAAKNGTVAGLADENIGLSYSGDAENPWNATATGVIGKVKTTPGGTCSDPTKYRSTLTITNRKTTKATLSFDYTVVVSEGTILVDNTTTSTSGSFSKELAAGGTVEVEIESGSISTATKITMTNVKLIYDTEATVTFLPAEHGSYTVGSTTGSTTITGKWTHTQRSTTAYQVKATPAAGYQFMDWYDVGNKKSISRVPNTELNIEETCTIKARFTHKDLALFETGGLVYDNLTTAIAATSGKTSPLITQVRDGTISGSYTIPSGVTLLIPFDEGGTLYTDAPAAIRTTPASKAFRTLTMSEGTSITVNGAISLGGRYFAAGGGQQGRSVGDYGCIKMADNSSITVKNGGNLYAWGFISGSGSILAESGATVYEFYQIADFRGGSASSNMHHSVFPFSQYFVQNIEVPLTLNAGANEIVFSGVHAMSTTYTTAINFIGDTGMFKVESGSFTKDYDEKSDRLVFTVNGKAALNKLSLKLAGQTVNSESYVLPITNNITINIQSGNVTINQDAALLAGVEVNIAKGAGLTVADRKNIYFYDSDEWNSDNFVWGPCKFKSVAYAPGKAYDRSNNDLVDAKMDVNGSVTANGAIYTTKGGADICSSKGTGKYVQQGKPGTETATHQYNANGNNAVTIPITPAKLKNADGADKPYTETAGSSAGATFTYCTCPTCGGGKWTNTNDLQVAAIINGNGEQVKTCATLEAAVNAYSPDSSTAPTNYIKLLHNTTEDIKNITKDIYLDLNGRTVTGDISVTGNHKLYGMDSSAKVDYTTAPKGKIVGTVKGCAPTYQTPPTVDGEYDRYVAILSEENGTSTLSFHRFNISVTGYRFELATGDTPQCALFFIGKFQGDDAAKNHLTELGFTLKDENGNQLGEDNYKFTAGTVFPPMPKEGEASDSEVVCSGDAYLFEAYLKRSFDKAKPDGYTKNISATAQATFDNGGKQQSGSRNLSFEDAWTNPGELDPAQKEILKKFLDELGIKQ